MRAALIQTHLKHLHVGVIVPLGVFQHMWATVLCWVYLSVLCLVSQSCPSLCNPMDCSLPGSSVCGDSPGKDTGVGCHVLLQGIFSTQELNQWPALQVASLPAELPGKSHGKPRQCIKKQRHHFANKGPYSQSYGFCSSHVWM